MKKIFILLFVLLNVSTASASVEVEELKNKILKIAASYEGKGYPDFKIQNELEPYVNELLKLAPQRSIKERLPLVSGLWTQVWGPYDYRNGDRGVDPTLGIYEIYQYVSTNGYYYNISPVYKKNGKVERIGYLRGEYDFSDKDDNTLDVKFIRYKGMKSRPTDKQIYDFVAEAENGTLPNQTSIVPTFIVKLFFQGGSLIELYTDEDIRILYGSNGSDFKNRYLYVMKRVI